jgi:phospholipase/carboxylesterase
MTSPTTHSAAPPSDGRLLARPSLFRNSGPAALALPEGIHKLAFPADRQALLYVPPARSGGSALMVLLHGARGQHGGAETSALQYAVQQQVLLLIPEARGSSWDMFRGGYGVDLAFLDQILMWVMRRHDVATDAITLAGFSDGASYALSVGLMNGELFSDIVAFSPGCMLPKARHAAPRIFIGHGTGDAVLPVQRGQQLARQLADEGYLVRYAEFAGGHVVPPALAQAAFALLGPGQAPGQRQEQQPLQAAALQDLAQGQEQEQEQEQGRGQGQGRGQSHG